MDNRGETPRTFLYVPPFFVYSATFLKTAILAVTATEVLEHKKSLLSQVNARILAAGNLFKDEAIEIAEIVEAGLGQSPLSPTQLNERCLVLPQGQSMALHLVLKPTKNPITGSNYIYSAPIRNPNQANSSLTYFTHFGPIIDQKLRVGSALLTQILSEPAFNVLRTREQLGYIVSCSAWTLPGSSEKGLRIVVQSEKNPEYLETRVEAFLDEMKIKLEEMSDEDFITHRNGLEKKWLESNKNLAEEVSKYLVHINSGQWDFLRSKSIKSVIGISQ